MGGVNQICNSFVSETEAEDRELMFSVDVIMDPVW